MHEPSARRRLQQSEIHLPPRHTHNVEFRIVFVLARISGYSHQVHSDSKCAMPWNTYGWKPHAWLDSSRRSTYSTHSAHITTYIMLLFAALLFCSLFEQCSCLHCASKKGEGSVPLLYTGNNKQPAAEFCSLMASERAPQGQRPWIMCLISHSLSSVVVRYGRPLNAVSIFERSSEIFTAWFEIEIGSVLLLG